MPPSMLLAEARDALVIGDERAGELDRRGDQEPVGRVAMFEMMEPIAASRGPISERDRFDARAPRA